MFKDVMLKNIGKDTKMTQVSSRGLVGHLKFLTVPGWAWQGDGWCWRGHQSHPALAWLCWVTGVNLLELSEAAPLCCQSSAQHESLGTGGGKSRICCLVNPPTCLLPAETFVIIMESATTSACNKNHGSARCNCLVPRGGTGLFSFHHCLQCWARVLPSSVS